MKAQARQGVAQGSGGRATPWTREPDEWDEVLTRLGYIWCGPCAEWHRPPICWIDEAGRSALDIALDPDSFRS